MNLRETPLTLQQAQDAVCVHAPRDYYATDYRAMEDHYLPELCHILEGGLSPRRIVEVGPGWGTMMVWLAGRGHELAVVDLLPLGTFVTPELVGLCGARYFEQDVCAGPVEDLRGWADVLVMTQVLPHLKFSPEEALQHAAAMLRPGGECIVSVLDADRHPGTVAAYGTAWHAVPRYGDAPPCPEMVVSMFTGAGLAEVLGRVFGENEIVFQPADCSVLFGYATKSED